MIDPSTNLLELIFVSDRESHTVAHAFDGSWLCHYPRPLICLHDKGTKFTGIEFQELLQCYGIKAVIATTANPQTNAILECTHQVIANQLQSLCLMSIELTSLADIQHELLAPVQWAMNSTYLLIIGETMEVIWDADHEQSKLWLVSCEWARLKIAVAVIVFGDCQG